MANYQAYENIGGDGAWYEYDQPISAANAGEALAKAADKWAEDNKTEAIEVLNRTTLRVHKVTDAAEHKPAVRPEVA